jgi:dTDP-4-dehydrorhamnose reductase
VKVLLTGAGGMLAHALHAALAGGSHEVALLARAELDVTDARRVDAVIGAERPEVVVQCAAYTRVDDAERDEDTAQRVNGDGARNVARACRAIGARFVYPSTDYVFDGSAHAPYAPHAATAPLSAYGRSKLAGENATVTAGDYLIVRTSWLYGHHGHHFVCTVARRARERSPLRVVNDQRGAPTWTHDLASQIVCLLEHNAASGIYHATNAGQTSWFDFAVEVLHVTGLETDIAPVSTAEFARTSGQLAPRPHYSVLDCSGTYAITGSAPHWKNALVRAVEAGVHEC